MSKVGNVYTVAVSESFEPSLCRWLVHESMEGRMTPKEAIVRFNFNPVPGFKLLSHYLFTQTTLYSPDLLKKYADLLEKVC